MEKIMIDIKTLEKLFQLQFEEGEITITPFTQMKIEEKQNFLERFVSFITGNRYTHKSVMPVDLLRLDWTISDKEHYNICFTPDVLNKLDITNAITEFVKPQSLKLKIARDRNLNTNL